VNDLEWMYILFKGIVVQVCLGYHDAVKQDLSEVAYSETNIQHEELKFVRSTLD
jgi:hypothetical protein